jgi:uncharacterized protein
MRMLVFSDIHGSTTGTMTTMELCQKHKPDLVVICGDITNFDPLEWAEGYLSRIRTLVSDRTESQSPGRVAAVPGNCDPKDLPNIFGRTGIIDLHRRKQEIGGIVFGGAGGADYTPFNTPFEFEDDTFSQWLRPLMEENMIMVTHAPAHGYLDTNYQGSHRGSNSIRAIVDQWRPILMLSGHMHEARGIESHNGTVFVNPGPAKDGFGALVELLTPEELGTGRGTEPIDWKRIRESVEARLLQV